METLFIRQTPSLLIAAALLLSQGACTADKVGGGAVEPQEDGGTSALLPAPVLGVIPETTPNNTVAIRGNSDGKRVVVQGGTSGATVTAILPGGTFCTDVSLEVGAATNLTVYALGDGLISEATSIVVTKDATAPQPASPTCSGSSPNECGAPEICDNEADENCDGWVDICDPQCNDCIDDNLEPNDFAVNVPVVESGTYELQICPCRDDWFAFERRAGQRIRVTADFVHSTLPLNLRLYQATATGEQGDFVAGSFTATDQESIDTVVETDGLYYLRAYPFGGTPDPAGSYTLTIQ